MATLSTLYTKTTLLPLFKNIHISYRSIHATRWGTIYHHQSTHVTIPQRITIIKRFMFRKTIDKGKECVGDHCKETLQAMTTVNPNRTATPPVDNAAGNLQKNPDAQNTPLPLTEITQPMTPPTTSQDMPQPAPKFTKPDSSTVDVPSSSQGVTQDNLKKAVRGSYNNDGQNKLESTTTGQLSYYEVNDTITTNVSSTLNSSPISLKKIMEDPVKATIQEMPQSVKPIKNINKNKSTWLEEAPPIEKNSEKPVRKKAFASNEDEIEVKTEVESTTSSSPEILVGTLNPHPDTKNLDYMQKHPTFATENPTTNKLEVFAYATSNKGLTEVSGTRSEGYTTHLDQIKIDGSFKPLMIDSHARTVTDDYGVRVQSPIPVVKIAANDSYGNLIPTKEIEGQFAMIVLPPKEVNPADFTLDVEATAYANQPHIKEKLEAMKAHTDKFQATPYRPSDYLSEDINDLPKEEFSTQAQNETYEEVD